MWRSIGNSTETPSSGPPRRPSQSLPSRASMTSSDMLRKAEEPDTATSDRKSEAAAEPFYIASRGPSARPRRTLKYADTFAVFDSHGDMGASAGGPDGLFDHDTRYLSRLEMLINGMQPLLLGSSVRDDNVTLTADLTNPDIFYDGHIALQRDALHIVRTAYLWNGTAHQRIAIQAELAGLG